MLVRSIAERGQDKLAQKGAANNRGRIVVAQAALATTVILDAILLPSPVGKAAWNCIWDFYWPPYFGSFLALIVSTLVAYFVEGRSGSRLRLVTTVLLMIYLIGIAGFVIDYPHDWYYYCAP